jgi:hypothetical protein
MRGCHIMGRTCRIAALMVCLGLITGMLSACFGSSEDTVTTVSSNTVTSAAITTTTAFSLTTASDSTLIDGIPSQYANALGNRPIVVLFYEPGGVEDEKVLNALRSLATSFSSYTVLMYDYRVPAAYGDLPQDMQIGYLPYMVLIDRYGGTRAVWNGYVDKATLNQSLLTLGSY